MVLRALIVAALLVAPAEHLGRSVEGRPIDVVHVAGDGQTDPRGRLHPRKRVRGNRGDETSGAFALDGGSLARPPAESRRLRTSEPHERARCRPQPRLPRRNPARDEDRAEADPAPPPRRDALVPPAAGGGARLGPEPDGRATVRAARRRPYRALAWPPGSASRWQNEIGQISFVVELPAGELADAAARRYADAVLRLAE